MKRFLLLTFTLTGIILCTEGLAQGTSSPYTASYSSNFKMGKADQAAKILEVWKDWDDNQLGRHDYFADTLIMMFSDGGTLRGKQANMDAATKYRAGFSKVVSTIHAWVPLNSVDRNDDMVCIWGQEVNTKPDGTSETRDLHEVWWFNKDGKISMVRQWAAKFGE